MVKVRIRCDALLDALRRDEAGEAHRAALDDLQAQYRARTLRATAVVAEARRLLGPTSVARALVKSHDFFQPTVLLMHTTTRRRPVGFFLERHPPTNSSQDAVSSQVAVATNALSVSPSKVVPQTNRAHAHLPSS